MRTSTFARNASIVALLVLLAGCSGGTSQTPATSPSANSLAQRSTASTSHGFMQTLDAKTTLMYMSSWGTDPSSTS